MVFWSFCIGFVVILEVAQGCYYNDHILDIKKTMLTCAEYVLTCGRPSRYSGGA
jgi:hypothetical protein